MSVPPLHPAAKVHRFLLAVIGLIYCAQPLYIQWDMQRLGQLPLDNSTYIAFAAALVSLLLATPFIFRAVRAPSRWYHFFAVTFVVAVIPALAGLPTGLLAASAGYDLTGFSGPLGAMKLVGALVALSMFLSTIVSIATAPAKAAPTVDDYEFEPVKQTRKQRNKAKAELTKAAVIDVFERISFPARMTARLHWLVVRLVGLATLVPAIYIAHWFFTDAPEGVGFVPDGRRAGNLVIVGVAAAALLAWPTRLTKMGAVFVPLQFRHWFASVLVFGAFSYALLYFTLPAYGTILEHPAAQWIALMNREFAIAAALCCTILPFATWIMTPKVDLTLPDPNQLRPYSAVRHGDMPEVKKLSRKEEKARRAAATVDNGKLPTIGAAMKLYLVTDWLVLRLLGIGLLCTAYLQWTFIEGGREFNAAQLAYGQDPMHALYFYAGFGALLAVPFLLPLFIVRPSHVAGGLLKALILVVAGLVLLPMTHVGIDLFFNDLYRPTLHATVPRLFKAVMGVAITSALLISFFRQLGKTPKVDYTGRVIRDYSPTELAEMRHARMPG